MAITFVVCIEEAFTPPHVEYLNNGDVVVKEQRVGTWTEYYPYEGTHLQYARVFLLQGQEDLFMDALECNI